MIGGDATSPFTYDPRFHTFESWASLMCEQYSAQQLEIPNSQTDWKDWARSLRGIDLFSKEAVPKPDNFDDWSDWAAALFNAMI